MPKITTIITYAQNHVCNRPSKSLENKEEKKKKKKNNVSNLYVTDLQVYWKICRSRRKMYIICFPTIRIDIFTIHVIFFIPAHMSFLQLASVICLIFISFILHTLDICHNVELLCAFTLIGCYSHLPLCVKPCSLIKCLKVIACTTILFTEIMF